MNVDTPDSNAVGSSTEGAPGAVEAHRARRLNAACLEDWAAMVRQTNVRPPWADPDPSDPRVQAAFCEFAERLGPIPTPDSRAVAAAIDHAHFENDMSSIGTQRCVIVDGRPHTGKTHAALAKAFADTRTIWDAPPVDPATARSIPYIYAEIPPRAQAPSVYQAILAFTGLPVPSPSARRNATSLAGVLRDMAPLIGLRGVILDDCHGLAGTDRAILADILKTVVTGIPATTVIIGAGMRERQIFDTLPGEQVLERASWVRVGDWGIPPRKGDVGPWSEIASYFVAARPLPDPGRRVALDSRRTLTYLAEGSRAKPATAIKWLKRAARHAIVNQTDLDLAALRATEPRL